MLRTFLVPTRDLELPHGFMKVVQRLAELYRARLITAVVRRSSELKELGKAVRTEADSTRPGMTAAQQVVLVGPFNDVICDKGHEADVIVLWHETLLGSGGQSATDELGHLIRHAPRPVWLFRQPIRCPEHIVVAYDGSAHSGRALHLAAHLSETVGARLSVLNVDESRDGVAQDQILSRAAGYCEPYEIAMERVGLFGRAAESIVSYASASGCDLLVVGAAGVGYLRGLLFGSVAGQVIATAPCSVLVAK